MILVLPWGVFDGTVRYSLLSGCLVSNGRQAPPKMCYFGRFCHSRARPVGVRPRAVVARRLAEACTRDGGHGESECGKDGDGNWEEDAPDLGGSMETMALFPNADDSGFLRIDGSVDVKSMLDSVS